MTLLSGKTNGAEWLVSMFSELLSPKLADHIKMSFEKLASVSVHAQAGLRIQWVSMSQLKLKFSYS